MRKKKKEKILTEKYRIPQQIKTTEISREDFDNIGYFRNGQFIEDQVAIGLLFRFKILIKIPEEIQPKWNELPYINEKYFPLPKNPHLSVYPLNWEGDEFLIILYGTHKPKVKQLRLLKKVMNTEIKTWIIRKVKDKNIETFGYQNKKTPKKIAGYWENERNVMREVKAFVKQLGHFPVSEVFKQMGRQDLLNAMKKNGGLQKFKIILGFPVDRIHIEKYPKGYWKDWGNVKSEIDDIIEEIGHFPTQKELSSIGKSTLSHAIINDFGGFMKVREIYGLEQLCTHDWTEEKIIEEFRVIIERIGFFPNHRELSEMGETKLASQINKKTKGITYLRKKMGYGDSAMKPMRYWYNEENVIKEVKAIIEEFGDLPSQQQLRKIGRSSLICGIKNFGGFTAFREKFGLKVYRKDNYWNEETIMKELLELVEEVGYFPSDTEMNQLGHCDLIHQIPRRLGMTISKLKTKMGFPIYSNSSQSSYSTIKGGKAEEFLLPYLKKYFEKDGFQITFNKLLDKGRRLELFAENPITKHTIGVDITTGRTERTISNKWNPERVSKQGYQHYVENLIVIVVANTYSDKRYEKWNRESPKNVLIIHWTKLSKLFGIKFEMMDRKRLYLLSKCNFRNKDKMIERWNGNRSTFPKMLSNNISDPKIPTFDKIMNRSNTIIDESGVFLPINIVVSRFRLKTKEGVKYAYYTHKEVLKKDGTVVLDAGHYQNSYPEAYQAWKIRVGLYDDN